MTSINPVSPNNQEAIANQIATNSTAAAAAQQNTTTPASTDATTSSALSANAASTVSASNVYWAGQEDLSSIAVQAGASATQPQGSQQSSAYSQLGKNVTPTSLPSPMDLASQSTPKTSTPPPSTPKI